MYLRNYGNFPALSVEDLDHLIQYTTHLEDEIPLIRCINSQDQLIDTEYRFLRLRDEALAVAIIPLDRSHYNKHVFSSLVENFR